jgi:DNA-binding beta-propeller fold protein YncE
LAQQQSSKTASASNGAVRQPTRLTRKRILIGLLVFFAVGLVAAALDLRFVVGAAPRRVAPNSTLVLNAQTLVTVKNDFRPGPKAVPVARGAGLVWTVNGKNNRLTGTNPESGRVIRKETVGNNPIALAVGYGAVWVANGGNGSITRVPLDPAKKVETLGLNDAPSAIATGSGYVWVASKTSSRLIRIDPEDKVVDESLHLANPPLAIEARDGRVTLAIGH